jgi:hypothetical protein
MRRHHSSAPGRPVWGLNRSDVGATPFRGSPDGVDEAGVVNAVSKTGRGVGPRMHVADEMSIMLSHIDGRPHEPARGHGLLGRRELNIRCQREVSGLDPIGVSAGQAEPSLRAADIEAEASPLRLHTSLDVDSEYGTVGAGGRLIVAERF